MRHGHIKKHTESIFTFQHLKLQYPVLLLFFLINALSIQSRPTQILMLVFISNLIACLTLKRHLMLPETIFAYQCWMKVMVLMMMGFLCLLLVFSILMSFQCLCSQWKKQQSKFASYFIANICYFRECSQSMIYAKVNLKSRKW